MSLSPIPVTNVSPELLCYIYCIRHLQGCYIFPFTYEVVTYASALTNMKTRRELNQKSLILRLTPLFDLWPFGNAIVAVPESWQHTTSESWLHVRSESWHHIRSESWLHIRSESLRQTALKSWLYIRKESWHHIRSESWLCFRSESFLYIRSEPWLFIRSES